MGRTLTGTVNYPNDEPWSGGVITDELLQGFTTSTAVYPATTVTITLQADGTIPDGTELAVPDTGTAYHKITKPNGTSFRVYLAAGAPVDLVELETIAGSSVDQDDLQTLLDAYSKFSVTAVSAVYQALTTDEYIEATGTFAITLPVITASVVGSPLVIHNISTGVITVTRGGSDSINGATTYTLYEGERVTFMPTALTIWRV